jgi:hypothetical protein
MVDDYNVQIHVQDLPSSLCFMCSILVYNANVNISGCGIVTYCIDTS